MKKTWLFMSILVLVLALVACGGPVETDPSETDSGNTESKETESESESETEHVHDVEVEEDPATCSTRGYRAETCKTCGEILSETALPKLACTPAGEATCTTDSVCSVCGKVLEAAKGHAWGEKQTVASTCAVEGKETVACTVCGFVEETVVPIIPHIMGAVSEEKEATCSENGYRKGACAICETEITETLKAGHNFIGESFFAAEDGTLMATCYACGDVTVALETRLQFDFDKELTEELNAYTGLTLPKPDTAIITTNSDRTVLQPRRRVAVDFDGELLYDARYFVISFDFYISQMVQPEDPSNPKRATVFAFVPGSANDGKASSNGMTFANFTKFTFGKGFVFSQYGTLSDIENGVPVVETEAGRWYNFMYVVDNVEGQAYVYLDGVFIAAPQMEEQVGIFGVNEAVDEVYEGYYSMFFGCDYIKEYGGQFDNFRISVTK